MRLLRIIPAAVLMAALASPLAAQGNSLEVGQPAPDFTLPDARGSDHTLSDYRGQYVVLEWLNYGCPYVVRHYESGNMQNLQETYTGKGVAWFSVVSSAPGNQGYYPPDEMNAMNEEQGNKATAVLLDPSGDVGHLFFARTTPHMMVINPDGVLIYNGAIDDRPRVRPTDEGEPHNYVAAALDEAMEGREVTVSLTQPYG
jgi:hypothetical protein